MVVQDWIFLHDMRKKLMSIIKIRLFIFLYIKMRDSIYDGQFNTYKANKDKKFNWLKLKKRTEKILSKIYSKKPKYRFYN